MAHIMLSQFTIRDIPNAQAVNVVRDWDLTSFRVQRIRDGADGRACYEIYNRTCINGGSRIVKTLDNVRKFIRSLS